MKSHSAEKPSLNTHRLILGTWNWSGQDWGRAALDDSVVFSMLDLALEAGITQVDTAPVYGPLQVEEQLGRYPRRKEFKISTKFGLQWPEPYQSAGVRIGGPGPVDSLRESLGRLQIEQVENFFLHHPPPQDLSPEAVDRYRTELQVLKEQGLIKTFGLANAVPASHPHCFQLPFEVIQAEYSALKRWADAKLFSTPQAAGAQIQVFSVLARGILAGRQKRESLSGAHTSEFSGETTAKSKPNTSPDIQDHRSRLRWFQEPQYSRILAKIEDIRPMATDYGVSPAGLFYAWVLNHQSGFAIIAGCSKVSQLQEIIRASEIQLSASEVQRVGTLFPDSGVL